MSFHFRRAAALSFAAFLASATAGCDQSFTWVGPVEGTDAVAAITVEEGEVRAYVCGGPTTYSTLTHWFEGSVENGNAFEAISDDQVLYGYVGDDFAYGVMSGSGAGDFYFDARPVEGGIAGLYAVEDSGCSTGVIVWDDGDDEPSLQGTWCDSLGNFAQVTPVYPIGRIDGAIHVQVDLGFLGEDLRDLYVTPISAR